MYFDDDNNSNIFNFDNFNDFNNNNLTSDVSNNYNASSENCGNICEVEGTEYYTNDCNYGLPYEDNTGEPTNFDTNIYYPPPPPPPPQQQQFVPCNVNPYVQQNINWNYPYACSSYLMNNTTNFMNLGMMTQAKNIEGTTPLKVRNLEARPCIDALSCTNGTAHDEFTDEVMMMITATSATATADNSNKREEEEEGTTKVLHKTDLKTATEGQGPTSAKRNKGSSSGGRTRIAAHEFRQKQKLYIYSLEKRVAELTAVNSEMQSRLNLMCNENTIIKEHLAYLRGFIAQAVPGAEQDVCTMTGMAPNPQGNENEMNDDK